jgi:hypothetical protein
MLEQALEDQQPSKREKRRARRKVEKPQQQTEAAALDYDAMVAEVKQITATICALPQVCPNTRNQFRKRPPAHCTESVEARREAACGPGQSFKKPPRK